MINKICKEINSGTNNFLNFRSKLFLKTLFTLFTAFILFTGCIKQQGSDRMRKELANIYEQGLENPSQYFHMNRKMVEWMKDKAQHLPPEKIIFHRYLLSQELLRAGKPEAAILELESILSDIGSKTDRVNNSVRPLIDELALAYLRLGEQTNCIEHHAGESCIMPIVGDGIQVSRKNTKKAIDLYLVILNKYPDDLGSRWLLNIAYMAIGLYPDSVPKQYLIDGLMGDFQAEIPKFSNVADDLGVAINDISGGLSIEDFNNDGHLDLFVTSYGLNDPSYLFLADGNGRYNNFTSEAGLDGIVSGLNSIHADYNNDGYSDILVLRGAWLADAGSHPNSLLHNNGNGTFTDVTHDSGIISYHPTQTASWADFNLDGHLDLFIGNESNSEWQNIFTKNRVGLGQQHQSELYLNNGDGTFTEVSQEVGIDLEAFVKAAVWGDINNDGLVDSWCIK
jgi:tetratricopeptide (TPR) repeat protein